MEREHSSPFGSKSPLPHQKALSTPDPRTLSIPGCLLYAGLWVTCLAYGALRLSTAAGTLSLVILAAEALAALRVAVYGLYILYTTRTNEPQEVLLARKEYAFNLRIMVPCYKEALEVVRETVVAAAATTMPRGCAKCDDGNDPEKRAWVEGQLRGKVNGVPITYIADRAHDPGKGNGKSQNLNNALQHYIYGGYEPDDIPLNEVVATLDADMVPVPEFFLRMLPYLQDERDAIVQSPQHFWNIDHESDILENGAKLKWNVAYKGVVDQLDGVMCIGSNHVIRARAMAQAGWWPTWTVSEDVALAQEMAKLGYRGAYVDECLAVGEIPLTAADKYVQYTRFNQGYWTNWLGTNGSLWDSSKSWMLRLAGNGFHREQLCAIYVPVLVVAPAVALLRDQPLLTHLPWQLVLAWAAMQITQQAVVQYHLVRRPEHHCRSVVANWLSNLADCHLFWNVVAGCALTVLRAELVGRPLKFVVTLKTKSAARIRSLSTRLSSALYSMSTGRALGSEALLPDVDHSPKGEHPDQELTVATDPRAKRYTSRAAPDPVFPWRHIGVHAVSLLLCAAACARGVSHMLGVQSMDFHHVVLTLWCAHNALPLCLLILRTLDGDSVLLRYCCRWWPRMYIAVVCAACVWLVVN